MEVSEIRAGLYQILGITATGNGPDKMRSGNIEITFGAMDLEIRALGMSGKCLRIIETYHNIVQISRLKEFNIPYGLRSGIKISRDHMSAITIFEPLIVVKE